MPDETIIDATSSEEETIEETIEETTQETLEESPAEESTSVDTQALIDALNDYQWELMQEGISDSSVDNASIYATSVNTADMVQLLLCANFLLALILGCLACNIFSKFLRS